MSPAKHVVRFHSSCFFFQAEGHYSSAHGGYSNVALGYGSVIAGGHQNTVGVTADNSASDAAAASGAFGFVGTGWGNRVSMFVHSP